MVSVSISPVSECRAINSHGSFADDAGFKGGPAETTGSPGPIEESEASGSEYKGAEEDSESDDEDGGTYEVELEDDQPDTMLVEAKITKGKKEKKGITKRNEVRTIRDQLVGHVPGEIIPDLEQSRKRKDSFSQEYVFSSIPFVHFPFLILD